MAPAPVENSQAYKDRAVEAKDNVANKAGDAKDRVANKAGDMKDKASDVAGDVTGSVAKVASKYDPAPSFIMSALCGGSGAYAYSSLRNPRAAAIAGGFAAAYYYSGHLLATGRDIAQQRMGYDIGTVASLGLLAAVGSRASATGEAYSVALASAGGISAVANGIKSYQMRTGSPHEERH